MDEDRRTLKLQRKMLVAELPGSRVTSDGDTAGLSGAGSCIGANTGGRKTDIGCAKMGNSVKPDLVEVRCLPVEKGQTRITLRTTSGDIESVFHCGDGSAGVVWVSGSLGGLDGPSFGIFQTLSSALVNHRISSLRLNYRFPGDFDHCVQDVLLGVRFLQHRGIHAIALVGHSFGGAVVIMAGTMAKEVKAVLALSSQTRGAHRVGELSPRPLLLIHGERDRNLPARCSWDIFERAKEPKEIVIYKGCGHFLRECHHELLDLLKNWLIDKLNME